MQGIALCMADTHQRFISFECRMCIAVILCIHMFVICVLVKSIMDTVNRTGTIYQHFASLIWLPIHENQSMPPQCQP